MEKRVVITGMGAITPIGTDVFETWEGIKNKKCGVNEITLFDTATFKTKLDAEIKNYNPQDYFDQKQSKRLDRSSQLGIIAAREAVKDSNITKENTNFDRVGTFVSSGIAGLTTIQEQCKINFEKGNRRVSPMFIPMAIANMPAGNIAIEFGFKGESISVLTACASSTHAIGEAYKTIKLGAEDVIIAGGTEAAICEVGIAGFENMKALSSSTDINRASIPFDKERNGFVMGEGAGVVILEELESALKRGAKIYGEVVGYGTTCDAYHMTSPSSDGEGAARSMKNAILDAEISPEQIGYINAHGTSTEINDKVETLAIKQAFGDSYKDVAVSSTKSMTGHLLGAAGAIEAIISVKAIDDNFIPATINYLNADEACDLNLVTNNGQEKEIEYSMSNSLGFGGHNATLIFKKWRNK